MWQIKKPEIKQTTLDFGSSGQGERQVYQLFSDGVQLINALELVDWDSEDTQVLVCESCGFTHCEPGNWVSIRKCNSVVLMLPASSYVWGESTNRHEYNPPSYLKKRGIPYFDLETYESLRVKHSSFPQIDRIYPLNFREATLLFQWNAPYRFLGEPPALSVRRDIVAGSSEGEVDHLERIEDLVERQYRIESPADLRPLLESEQVISINLDAAEFTTWKALAFDGSEYRLLVDAKYVVDPAVEN